jgi:hypothetical protein
VRFRRFRNARGADGQEKLSIGAEFHHRGRYAVLRCGSARIAFGRAIGDPDIARWSTNSPCGKPICPLQVDQFAVEVTCMIGSRSEFCAVCSATVDDPKMLAVGIHLESAGDADTRPRFCSVVIDMVGIARRLRMSRTQYRQ